MVSVRTSKRKYIPCRFSLGLDAALHLVHIQAAAGTWVSLGHSLMLSRWQEQDCPRGYFTVCCGSTCLTSLGPGAGKLAAASLPTRYCAMPPCSDMGPAWGALLPRPAAWQLGAQRWCQRGRAFPLRLVIAGGGGSLPQRGCTCLRVAWKELAPAPATAARLSGSTGCGLVFAKQDS